MVQILFGIYFETKYIFGVAEGMKGLWEKITVFDQIFKKKMKSQEDCNDLDPNFN